MRLAVLVIASWSAVASAQPVDPADPPSMTFERARKMYEKTDYYSASVELEKVLSGQSGDSPANVKRAQLDMAATLYQMRYHAASIGMVQRILLEGRGHPRHGEAVKWVVALGAIPGSPSPSYLKMYRAELEDVARALDEAARSALFYQLGAELAVAGEVDEARELLARVNPGSAYGARARLQLARLQLRRGRLLPGVAAAIARAGDPAIANEAARAIAESRYAAGEPEGAKDALRQLAASPAAAFARSRIELEHGALPQLAGAPVAAFEQVVVATACTRGWTDHLLAQAAATARNTRDAIDELLRYDDNAEIFEAVQRFLAETAARGAERPRPSAVVIRLALARIGAPRLWEAELSRELAQLSAADKAWQTTAVASDILQEVTVQESVAAADLGKLERQRLEAVRRDLGALDQVLGQAVAITAGPDAPAGRGLVVSDALCAEALGQVPASPQIAGPAAATGAPRGHGCAGCASGEPSLVLAIAWLVSAAGRRGRRDQRPRARARHPGTADAATPSRGP